MTKENQYKKPHVHRKRHIAKAVTWRIIGTLDTWIISWLLLKYLGEINLFSVNFSNDLNAKATSAATLIATLELITKTILYYFHERIWYSLGWIFPIQRARHLIKTISWRLIGAMDTILLVFIVFYILFSSFNGAAEVAISMFSIEIITKMILYYLHERAWFISNYGVTKRK
jgi:uncharacterized membrane protein